MAKNLWENNPIQYVRFIAEAESAGAFTPEVVKEMALNMDLTELDVCTIINNACHEFDEIVANIGA